MSHEKEQDTEMIKIDQPPLSVKTELELELNN